MKRNILHIVLFALVAIFVIAPTSAQAQGTKSLYVQYNERGVQLVKQGEYKAAIPLYTRALNQIKLNRATASNFAIILSNLAYCYAELEEYAKAAELYERIVDIYKIIGKQPSEYVDKLSNLAYSYVELNEYAKAVEVHKQVVEIRKKTGQQPSEYIIELSNFAYCYCELKEYEKSAELYEQVVDIYKGMGKQPSEYVHVLNNLAYCYENLSDYTRAIELHRQVLQIFKKTLGEEHNDYALSLNNLAICYYELGDFTNAIALYKKALKIYLKDPSKESTDYALSLNNLASCYYELDDFENAIMLHRQVLEIYQKKPGKESADYALSLNNLANCYNELCDYAKAIELHRQSLEIRKKVFGEDHPKYALSLNNLANCYKALGDYAKAIELNKQALKIYQKDPSKESAGYATSLGHMAECYKNLGNYTKAIELLKQALEIRKNVFGKRHPKYAIYLNNFAGFYAKVGDYTTALKFYKHAFAIFKQALGEEHPIYAMSLNNMAACYEKLEDYTNAVELLKQASAIYKKVLGEEHPDYGALLSNLTVIYFIAKQYQEIAPLWQGLFSNRKHNTIAQFRGLTSTHRKTYWEENNQHVIYPLHSYTPVLADNAECMGISYNSLLFSKGLILSASIEFDNVIRDSGNKELLAAFEELRTTRAILNTLYNKPIAERPEGETERLEKRAEELENILINGSKEYRDFTDYLKVEWQNVRDALGDNEVAVEFLAAENLADTTATPYYGALVLRKGWEAPKFVELTKADALKQHYMASVKSYDGVENLMPQMYYGPKSKELYALIWSKLEQYINKGDKVFFAADGLLHQMNIELFRDSTGVRANEKYSLYRVSSTREVYLKKATIEKSRAVLYGGLQYDVNVNTLKQESAKHQHKGNKVVYGFNVSEAKRSGLESLQELPATKTEIDGIADTCRIYKVTPKIYTATVGNEESFKALSGKKTPILHIATHGFFLKNEEVDKQEFFRHMQLDNNGPRKPDNSLKRSGLIFAGAQTAWKGDAVPEGVDDGILLAEEISTMDLSGTDLVVLSACETGLGEITSEGVFGLQRAFKKAGVKTLIMSLWKVDDMATSLFMRSFYAHWLEGKSKHDAFALAQKNVREYKDATHDFSNPKYWAAFIMLDDYERR